MKGSWTLIKSFPNQFKGTWARFKTPEGPHTPYASVIEVDDSWEFPSSDIEAQWFFQSFIHVHPLSSSKWHQKTKLANNAKKSNKRFTQKDEHFHDIIVKWFFIFRNIILLLIESRWVLRLLWELLSPERFTNHWEGLMKMTSTLLLSLKRASKAAENNFQFHSLISTSFDSDLTDVSCNCFFRNSLIVR